MKLTMYICTLILFIPFGQLMCSKPATPMPRIDEKTTFDMAAHRGSLDKLRAVRHAQMLTQRKSSLTNIEEPMPKPTIIPTKEKPAGRGSGCLSRTSQLVVAFFRYCTATSSDQE